MKLLRKVSAKEVKRCFVIAEHRPNKTRIGHEARKRQFAATKRKVLTHTTEELDAFIGRDWKGIRLNAYNSSDWYIGTVKTSEVGVWSRAGGLPSRWTNGSLAETALKVERALITKRLKKGRARSVIISILSANPKDLQKEKYLLPIIFQGDTGTRGRKRLKRKMKGDIDDGCMRSIALAISGRKTLKAYIGIPRK